MPGSCAAMRYTPPIDLSALRQRLVEGDRLEARRIVHSLKGAAATLGATQVQNCAAELEAAIQKGKALPELESSIEILETARAELTTAILQALPDEGCAAIAVDWALLRGIVARLDALLTENDMQANEVFRDAAPMLRAGLGPQTGVIERQINAFEYKRALTLLRAAVAGQSELHGVQPDYPLT